MKIYDNILLFLRVTDVSVSILILNVAPSFKIYFYAAVLETTQIILKQGSQIFSKT